MFKLRVRFRGHCAFAPKIDGSEARVFLLDKSQPDKAQPKLVPHHAAVTVSAAHLSNSSPDAPGRLVWFLKQARVRIIPPSSPTQPLIIEGFKDLGTPREPSLVRQPKKEDHGFWWLAPLEKACLGRQLPAGGGVVEKSFLQDKLEKNDADVLAARVEINTGSLQVSDFLKNANDFIVWRFRSFGGNSDNRDHLQILAAEMLLEQDIDGDYVVIEAASLTNPDDPTEREYLTLYPRDEGDGLVIDLIILNEEGEEFMPNRASEPPILKTPRDRDRLFESFYKISKNPPPPDETPMPVADYLIQPLAVAAEPAQSAPPCSPSRLDPYVV